MSKKNKGAGWYYVASCGFFGGIFWSDDFPREPETQSWGPFPTFGEAKKDAISFFRTDIDTAFSAIREIRARKKPRVK